MVYKQNLSSGVVGFSSVFAILPKTCIYESCVIAYFAARDLGETIQEGLAVASIARDVVV